MIRNSLAAWLAATCFGISAVFAFIALRRSELPYGEEGNYFDGLVNYHQQAVLVFAGIAIAAVLFALTFLYLCFGYKRKR